MIEQFLYPKLGPGQMWEEVARRVREIGGEVLTGWDVKGLWHVDFAHITEIISVRTETGETRLFRPDYVFSTMPVRELVAALTPVAPQVIQQIASGLEYRDFITVGILYKSDRTQTTSGRTLTDNWIYIQEPAVRAGRLQIFNNWSPAMVGDKNTTWIGVEYFCRETDDLWRKGDSELIELAKAELTTMKLVSAANILDVTVIRAPKAYPAYFGTYHRFAELSSWTDRFQNLFLIGRNGMHRYNNQDHSMLTAMVAVDNIVNGVTSRENLWTLNTEQGVPGRGTAVGIERCMKVLSATRSRRLVTGAFILLLFAGLVSYSFLQGWRRAGSDFPNYYTAAVLVVQKQHLRNLYDWPWFQRQMNYTGIQKQLGGYIPQTPLTMLPMIPLVPMAMQAAKRTWLVADLFLIAGTLFFSLASAVLVSLTLYSLPWLDMVLYTRTCYSGNIIFSCCLYFQWHFITCKKYSAGEAGACRVWHLC